MNKYAQDPLVQYLKKHAKQIETNVEAFATQMIEDPVQSADSDFADTPAEKKKAEDEALLKSLFSHYPNEKSSK